MLVTVVGIAVASNGNGRATTRVIADTANGIDKFIFKIRGCEILHELSDATALKCPADIVPKLNVREDTIFHIMDMGANLQINADDVWALGYTGLGVTVAILDTGIDTDNPELINSIVGGQGFGYATYEDDHGHGTHVAGIITANGVGGTPLGYAKGVAPDAGVWMAKVCDASGSCYSSDIAAAIEYVVKGPDGTPNTGDEPAKIISISLGGGGTSRANCDSDYLASKVNWAVNNGVTVVAAAGNTAGKVSSPGCASKAIAVGAVDKSDVRASWSGTGSALGIMAPGVSIYSSLPGNTYASWSGTSMATPHISATVALLRQANPSLTDSQIKDALYKTAKDLGTSNWDKYYGWGRVDTLGAVNYVKPPEPECTEPADCDDGLYCNGAETCISGVCQAGTPMDCSALSDQCNNGVCDEGVDNCIAQPKVDGTTCDDGLYCNVGETCQAGVCIGGATRNCGDGVTCTADSCNETSDNCENVWPTCGISDGCCGPECSSANDLDCPTGVLCWSGSNQYLYNNNNQAKKFCKCAQGTYGYKSYSSKRLKSTVYKYQDTGNNENWAVTSQTSYTPVYSVTCTDSKAYLTNRDYYSKQTRLPTPTKWGWGVDKKMKKIFSTILGLAVLFSILSVPVATRAVSSTSSAQELITSLQQQIEKLKTQITELNAQLESLRQLKGEVKETVKEVKGTLQLIKQLRRGMTGDDVKLLQEFLATDPDIYPEGLISGYFGPMTERAVKKLQKRMCLDQVGNVGPQTLRRINELLEEGAGKSYGGEGGHVPAGLLRAPGIQQKLCATSTPDTTAPVISDVVATSTTATTTQIKWLTNEKANSKVWYSTSTPVVATTTTPVVSSSDYVTSHSINLTGLTATTTYYYLVSSADKSGNATTATEKSFTTLSQ